MSDTLHRTQVGRRLRAAIAALGITQVEVGRELGASTSKMNNWLRGDHYPAELFVKQFCDRYGITTEWIYRGIVTGLPSDLANTLWKEEQTAGQKDARASRDGSRPSERDQPTK